MKIQDQKKEITIYLNARDEIDKVPVHKAILEKLIHLDITGCTITKSNAGFGSNFHVLAKDDRILSLFHKDTTMIITIIESAGRTDEIIKILDHLIGDGIVTIKDVDFIRYTKTKVTKEDLKIAEKF